jgi:hypothetical protein
MARTAYERLVVGHYTDGSPVVVNLRTWAMLDETRERLGYSEPLTVVQGSYHEGSESAGTHAGGGAVDLTAYEADHKVHALRAIGFAAWHRVAIPHVWEEHVHAIAIGDQELSAAARAQVADYYAHRNGLADHGPDPTWHPDPIPVFDFPRWRKENTLLPSDKKWLDERFDALHSQLSVFRQNTVERDRKVAAKLAKVLDDLHDTATKEQVQRARADLADIKQELEAQPPP